MEKTKRSYWLIGVLLIVLGLSLQSCNDDDDRLVSVHYTPSLWATVRIFDDAFYLDCDRWGTLWPTNVDFNECDVVDGQRVLTSFNLYQEGYENYDYAVNLRSLKKVLTKEVEPLNLETETEYGNDSLLIYKSGLSLSGGHLNVVFLQNLPAYDQKHRISLLQDSNSIDENGYVHLELRYNDYDDLSGRRAYGMVSFDLTSILEGMNGVVLKFNSEMNGEVEVTLHSGDSDNQISDEESSGSSNSFLE